MNNNDEVKKASLREPTIGQAPKMVKITIKGVSSAGIADVPFSALDLVVEKTRLERDKIHAQKFGFDPSKTGGTGFQQIKGASRVRLLAFVEQLRTLGYNRVWMQTRTTYTKGGNATCALDLHFRKDGGETDAIPVSVTEFLRNSYVDQVSVHANPTSEGERVDSVTGVLGAPPKGGNEDDPGQHLAFDGKTYRVVDLMPEDEDYPALLDREDRAYRSDPENATVPNPFAGGLIRTQSIGTNFGDLMRAKVNGTK